MTALRLLSVAVLAIILVLQCEARPRKGPGAGDDRQGAPIDGPQRPGPGGRRDGPPREGPNGEKRPPRHHRKGCLPLACNEDSDCPSNRTTCVQVELNFDGVASRGLCLRNKTKHEEVVEEVEREEREERDVAEHLARHLLRMACEKDMDCPEKSEGCNVGPFALDFNNTQHNLMFCQRPNVTIESGQDLFTGFKGCPKRRHHDHSHESEDEEGRIADEDEDEYGMSSEESDASSEESDASSEEYDASSEEDFEPVRHPALRQGRVQSDGLGRFVEKMRRGPRSAESHERKGKRGSKVCRIQEYQTNDLLEEKACENNANCSDTASLQGVDLNGKLADIFFCEKPERNDDSSEEGAEDKQFEEMKKYAESLMSGACQVHLNETILKRDVSCKVSTDECSKGPATFTIGSNTFTLTLCPNQEAEDLDLFWTESFNSCLKDQESASEGGRRAQKSRKRGGKGGRRGRKN